MRAIQVDRHGGTEVLTVREVPEPVPRAGEALIRVVANSLNPVDWKTRRNVREGDGRPDDEDLGRHMARSHRGSTASVGPEGITSRPGGLSGRYLAVVGDSAQRGSRSVIGSSYTTKSSSPTIRRSTWLPDSHLRAAKSLSMSNVTRTPTSRSQRTFLGA
jgi:hypothetical protein